MDLFVTIFFTIGFMAVIVMIGWAVVDYVNKRNEEKNKRQRDYDKINEQLDRIVSLLNEIRTILKTS